MSKIITKVFLILFFLPLLVFTEEDDFIHKIRLGYDKGIFFFYNARDITKPQTWLFSSSQVDMYESTERGRGINIQYVYRQPDLYKMALAGIMVDANFQFSPAGNFFSIVVGPDFDFSVFTAQFGLGYASFSSDLMINYAQGVPTARTMGNISGICAYAGFGFQWPISRTIAFSQHLNLNFYRYYWRRASINLGVSIRL